MTTTEWNYVVQSITLGNEPLYYLKVFGQQGYIIPLNDTFSIPLDISSSVIYNNTYATEQPIIDRQANKFNNAPSGIDLYTRSFNDTNVLYITSSISVNANDILFILNDLEISL
jgi:hypothetical protein